jgi:thiol-disulfide isomerase/thioredoxin
MKLAIWLLLAAAQLLPAVQVGEPAPALGADVRWIKGAPVPEFQKGRVYVIDLWGTWCPPCLADIPHLKKVAEQYRGKGVVFIAIAISPEAGIPPEEFVRSKGELMPYMVAEDVADRIDKRWADPNGSSGAGSYPTLAIVDQDGAIAFIGRGYPIRGFEETLAKVVERKWDVNGAAAKVKAEARLKVDSEPLIEDARRKLAAGDFQGCLAIYRKLLASNPVLFGMRAIALFNPLRDRASKQVATDWARELIEKHLAASDELLAWPLATLAEAIVYRPDPSSTPRSDVDAGDFALALKAAARANEVTRDKDPWRIQTLASVTFASGDRQRGLELIERSVRAAKDADWGVDELVKIEAMRDRLRAAAR